MPGIHISPHNSDGSLIDGINRVSFDDRYNSQQLTTTSNHEIRSIAYPAYPISTYTIKGCTTILEGQIYNLNKTQIQELIRDLVQLIRDNYNLDNIESKLNKIDGEFIIYIIDSDIIYILNDLLGRLPFFYYEGNKGVVAARHKSFINSYSNQMSIDQLSSAQYLLFGYTLGKRTLFNDIYRAPPASILKIDDKSLDCKRISKFNVQPKRYEHFSSEKNIAKLDKLFTKACQNRNHSDKTNLISLTGGLDSRAVLAAFSSQNIPHISVTRDHALDSQSDIDTARDLARAHNSKWKRIVPEPPTGRDFDQHLSMSSGADPLATAYATNYFEIVRDKFSPVTYYTGDGGDKALPDLRPSKSLNNLDDLINYIITADNRFSINTVNEITGINKKAIRDSVRKHIETFPESDLAQQYVHFQIFCRGFNWLFEAEDTNRCYVWSTTPFYAYPFFEYAMNCPDSQKRFYRLSAQFLSKLSKPAAAIPNVNLGAPPATYRHTLLAGAADIVKQNQDVIEIVRQIKTVLNRDSKSNGTSRQLLIDCYTAQLNQTNNEISTILKNYRDYIDIEKLSRTELYLLVTLTSVFDDVQNTPTILQQRSADVFPI